MGKFDGRGIRHFYTNFTPNEMSFTPNAAICVGKVKNAMAKKLP